MLKMKQSLMLSLFFSINSYAQNYFPQERPLELDALKAPGVERMGAVPLPIPAYGNMPVSQNMQSTGSLNSAQMRKGSFESTYMPGRVIYLNGENIGSIRNQELENVNVRIDQNGNLYIEAPQYEVASEQSYHPLLPKELPQFKKENIYEQMPLPQGVYSKQSGKTVSAEEPEPEQETKTPPPMAKEIIPEINSEAKIPSVKVD